jgi:hypothetical protein
MKLIVKILLMVVLTLALNGGSASAGPAERINGIWQTGPLDTLNSLGEYNSIAFSPYAGTAFISYYDETNQRLKAATFVGKGNGNCGVGVPFFCETVDSHADRGRPSSIAVNPITGYPAIAYYNATDRDLYYAAYACSPGPACAWGAPTLIDNRDTVDGDFLSLKFNPSGQAVIAYHASQPAGTEVGSLRLAIFTAAGGNCGGAQWQCSTILNDAAQADFGKYPSLAFDSLNFAHISFSDGDGSLWLVEMVSGASGNCGPGGSGWRCQKIDPGNLSRPRRFSSIGIGPDNAPRIAYAARAADGTTDNLMVAVPVASGGSCGATGNWNCLKIDSLNAIPAPGLQPLALAVDGANFGQVAYSSGGNLWVGSELAVLGTGNCGQQGVGLPVYLWKCVSLRTDPIRIIGEYVSIGLNASGLPSIAYSIYTPPGPGSGYDLYYATLRLPTFLPLIKK